MMRQARKKKIFAHHLLVMEYDMKRQSKDADPHNPVHEMRHNKTAWQKTKHSDTHNLLVMVKCLQKEKMQCHSLPVGHVMRHGEWRRKNAVFGTYIILSVM
jgi:hypothetical protein